MKKTKQNPKRKATPRCVPEHAGTIAFIEASIGLCRLGLVSMNIIFQGLDRDSLCRILSIEYPDLVGAMPKAGSPDFTIKILANDGSWTLTLTPIKGITK